MSPQDCDIANDFVEYVAHLHDCVIVGPGNARFWQCPGFDEIANQYMEIIKQCNQPIFKFSRVFGCMKKRTNDSWHFDSSPATLEAMSRGIINLSHFLALQRSVQLAVTLEEHGATRCDELDLEMDKDREIQYEIQQTKLQQQRTNR